MQELNKIKGYRTMVGLTQTEIAEKIGISRETYTRKESSNNFSEAEKLALITIFNQSGLNLVRTDLD
jgi:putative transcriptional regulator